MTIYPERIVCLAAEIPEILYELNALDRVVGISAYTTRPAEALSLTKVSGFQYGSVERILRERPDLVILTSGVQKELASKLAAAGATLLHLNPHRLDDLFSNIRLLGNLVGEPTRAHALCERLQSDIAQIRRQGKELSWHPKVYFEEWMDPLLCGTGWVSDLIEIAGGTDVFRARSLAGRLTADRRVTEDEWVQAAPDIMLASWCGKPFEERAVRDRPHANKVPAVQNGHVYEVDGTILQFGPMLVDVLRDIHRLIANVV